LLNSFHSLAKVNELYSLSNDILRKNETPWLIKCPNHVSIGDVEYFNTLPHVTTLAKYLFNIKKERPIIVQRIGSDAM
jgi:hypothetical protein